MTQFLSLSRFLGVVILLAAGCDTNPAPPQQQQSGADRSDSQAAAKQEIQTVVEETIRLLEAEKYREWAEKYAPAREQTPERLAKLEQQIRAEPEKVQEVLAGFRQAQTQSPEYHPDHNAYHFQVKDQSGNPGQIIIAQENGRWFIKKMDLGRRPRRAGQNLPADDSLKAALAQAVPREATSILHKIEKLSGPQAAWEALEQSGLLEHSDGNRRAWVVQALAALRDDVPAETQTEIAKALVRLANDSEASVRRLAIGTLQEAGEDSRAIAETAVPVLVMLLGHEDATTRAAALGALGDIGDAQAYRQRDMSGEQNPLVQAQALPKLVERLEDADRNVREDVPRVLAKITEYNLTAAREVLPAVQKRLDHKEAGPRAVAAESLAQMAERMGRVRLSLLKSQEEPAQTKAREITDLLKPALAKVAALEGDEDEEVRREAQRAAEALRKATE